MQIKYYLNTYLVQFLLLTLCQTQIFLRRVPHHAKCEENMYQKQLEELIKQHFTFFEEQEIRFVFLWKYITD